MTDATAGPRVQFMALVGEDTMHDLDALRLVTRRSRARLAEDAMRPQLEIMKVTYAMDLERLEKLAEAAGATVQEYVSAYATVYARKTYGVGLDALEADDKAVRAQIRAARKEAKAKPAAA